MKDSSGDPERLLAELEVFDGWLYVGAAAILLMAGSLGIAGAVLAVANVDPSTPSPPSPATSAQRALLAAPGGCGPASPTGWADAIADRFGTSRVARLG